MTKKQIEVFLNRLEGKEGCSFRQKNPKDTSSITWFCKGGNDKTFAVKILTKMKIKKAEQDEFLALCDSYGGHCDCEILFNSAERLLQ